MFYLKVFLKSTTCIVLSFLAFLYISGYLLILWSQPSALHYYGWFMTTLVILVTGLMFSAALLLAFFVIGIITEDLTETAKKMKENAKKSARKSG